MSPGHVYIVFTTLTKPPKDKITLCVCASENLFFWINTQPQRHGVGQFQLCTSDHAALSHDCFLDLSRVTFFQDSALDPERDRGCISRELAGRILEFLEMAPPKTLPGKHLKIAKATFKKLAS